MLGIGYGDRPPQEVLAKADAAARKAIELDETVGEAHAALGVASTYYGWNWRFVENELRRAIELSPSYSMAHTSYGILLICIGRHEEGLEELAWGSELDHATVTVSGDFPFYLALFGRTEEALQIVQEKMLGRPAQCLGTLHYVLGVIYERQGKYAEAKVELEKAVKLNLLHTIPLGILGHVYAVSGEGKKAFGVIAQLDELARQRPVSHFTKAIVLSGLGDISSALDCLEKAYDERSPFLYMLNVFPWFNSLHSNSRFADLVRRVGLPVIPNRDINEKEVCS
jgi:Flp pilus assembly protein TadD